MGGILVLLFVLFGDGRLEMAPRRHSPTDGGNRSGDGMREFAG
jgi:hypothetical protein